MDARTRLLNLGKPREHNLGFGILSVSHCWEVKQHPDPFGSQAWCLVDELMRRKELEPSPAGKACLPQYHRTKQEQLFSSGP